MRPQFFCFIFGRYARLKPDATQHVHLKESPPVVIGNFFKRFRLKDAKIVYQDVHGRKPFDERVGGGGVGQIAGKAFQFRVRNGLANFGERFTHRFLGTAVDDDFRAFARQPGGDGQPDALG